MRENSATVGRIVGSVKVWLVLEYNSFIVLVVQPFITVLVTVDPMFYNLVKRLT